MITYECPHCHCSLQIDDRYAGQTGTCRKCGKKIAVPGGRFSIERLLTGISRIARERIAQKIDSNIKEGNSSVKVQDKLTEITELDHAGTAALEEYEKALSEKGLFASELSRKVETMRKKLTRQRRNTIAQTLQHLAISRANQIEALEQGQKFKVWITVGDAQVSDTDETNQAAGWISIDAPFPSGDIHPPSRPDCRCEVAYRTGAPDELDIEQVAEIVRRQAEAKASIIPDGPGPPDAQP